MSTSIPPCALGLDGATLSAWRDAQLPAEELQRIGAHVPTCMACGRILSRFEAVAVALKRQKELDPGNRVWHGVLTRAAGRRGAGGGAGPNGNWRGIGALLAVAAVLALFVLLLGPWRSAKQVSPYPTTTAQVSPTASATSFKGPTFTPVPQQTTPAFTPPTPNALLTTWAASAKVATLNTQISATQAFVTEGISPDGKTLLGALATDGANGGQATEKPATFDFATRQVMVVPGMPSVPEGYGPPGCCDEYGNFLVAVISSAPGTTCGICHNVVWYYNSQTGRTASVQSFGVQRYFFSQGYVAIEDADAGIEVANLATGQVTQVVPGVSGSGSSTQGGGTLLALSAPYVFYSPSPPTNQVPTPASIIHVRDLSTGKDVVLSQLDQLESTNAQVALVMEGTTLYAAISTTNAQQVPTSTALYALPNFTPSDTAAPQQEPLPNTECGVPLPSLERLLSCEDAPSDTQYYYDRDQSEYLLVPSGVPAATPAANQGTLISGHYLFEIAPANANPSGNLTAAAVAEQVTIYDLNQVPTSAS